MQEKKPRLQATQVDKGLGTRLQEKSSDVNSLSLLVCWPALMAKVRLLLARQFNNFLDLWRLLRLLMGNVVCEQHSSFSNNLC